MCSSRLLRCCVVVVLACLCDSADGGGQSRSSHYKNRASAVKCRAAAAPCGTVQCCKCVRQCACARGLLCRALARLTNSCSYAASRWRPRGMDTIQHTREHTTRIHINAATRTHHRPHKPTQAVLSSGDHVQIARDARWHARNTKRRRPASQVPKRTREANQSRMHACHTLSAGAEWQPAAAPRSAVAYCRQTPTRACRPPSNEPAAARPLSRRACLNCPN